MADTYYPCMGNIVSFFLVLDFLASPCFSFLCSLSVIELSGGLSRR